MKRNKNNKPQEQEERHQVLETLIDERPSKPIITPNTATYSNTNNLVPTPQALIKLLENLFIFGPKSFSN